MITYYKLLDMLNRREMTRDQLRIAIGASANTITAISKMNLLHLKLLIKYVKCYNVSLGILWNTKNQTQKNGNNIF